MIVALRCIHYCQSYAPLLLLYYFLTYLASLNVLAMIFLAVPRIEYPLKYYHDTSKICRIGHENVSH